MSPPPPSLSLPVYSIAFVFVAIVTLNWPRRLSTTAAAISLAIGRDIVGGQNNTLIYVINAPTWLEAFVYVIVYRELCHDDNG